MDFFNNLLPTIEHWGWWLYWILFSISILESTAFIGLVIPGTTILIFTGFLASQGTLDAGDALWIMALGGIVGDALSFFLGRRGVVWFQDGHKIFKTEYLKKGQIFFQKYGEKSVIMARFIGPFRPIIPFVAGLFKMNTKKFFFFNITSAFMSAGVYLAIGYFFGHVWGRVHFWIEKVKVAGIILISVLIAGYIIKKIVFKKIHEEKI